jgi:hypothetical protein
MRLFLSRRILLIVLAECDGVGRMGSHLDAHG